MEDEKSFDNDTLFADRVITLQVGTERYALKARQWDVLLDSREAKLEELARFNEANAKLQDEKKFCLHPYRDLAVYGSKLKAQVPLLTQARDQPDQDVIVKEVEVGDEVFYPETMPWVVRYLELHNGRYAGELQHPPHSANLFSEFMRKAPYQVELEKLRWADAQYINEVTDKGLTFLCHLISTAESMGLFPLCDLLAYRLAMLVVAHIEAPSGTPLPEVIAPMPWEGILFPNPHDDTEIAAWADRNPTFFGLPPKKDNDRQPRFPAAAPVITSSSSAMDEDDDDVPDLTED